MEGRGRPTTFVLEFWRGLFAEQVELVQPLLGSANGLAQAVAEVRKPLAFWLDVTGDVLDWSGVEDAVFIDLRTATPAASVCPGHSTKTAHPITVVMPGVRESSRSSSWTAGHRRTVGAVAGVRLTGQPSPTRPTRPRSSDRPTSRLRRCAPNRHQTPMLPTKSTNPPRQPSA
ncbi:hypothetical protein LO762_15880 [Actinocorallia sp. API 0066]|uniref:hypothetical protein n=1 Tax=Actinocorallia sp. API 0066 TaxID=2896846 RepID=UPI001E40E07A|nr:hypothetical protein [Actinocorallia sp. API 0066]MCD0450657.1 hypothetical protein [Actinocorallia sp. API 0066]